MPARTRSRRQFLKTSAAGALGLAALDATLAPTLQAHPSLPGSVPAPAGGLRFRQIHLDFHTSEKVEGVGAQFDPAEFAATLAKAHVDSVTCFARCHHGYVYYDTKAFPERRHPHLRRNLLEEQIEACHARGIRVPIYATVQWDQLTADAHPEWRQVTPEGSLQGTPPFEPGFYRYLCLNSPYVEFLKAHLADLFARVPVDGLFLDIVKPQDCACPRCRRAMEVQGLNPADAAARLRFGREVMAGFVSDTTAFIRRQSRDCTIFYNGGHVDPLQRSVIAAYTHLELESLPSGGWGYLHFPMTARYARNLGVDCLGMTGKFHTSWGDFHSYKNRAALEFECFQMLALGARCSVGDQLHPQGKLDAATYELVGSVYAEVARKEPWCRDARPVTEIGVLTPEEFLVGRHNATALGATRLLQEGTHQFDFVDSRSDLSRYALLVLPDEIPVGPDLAAALSEFQSKGGALLATCRSGLNETKDRFAIGLGVDFVGKAPFSPNYLRPRPALARGLPAAEYVMYLEGMAVRAQPGSEVLADAVEPYFNRTWEHYFSHRQTPSSGKVGGPAVVRSGRSIYFAHPVFAQYHKNAPRWCKTLVLNALDLLMPEPLLRLRAPSSAMATLNLQPREGRLVVHLLHYVPERRGQDFDVIEDVIPIEDVGVSVRAPGKVRAVETAPEGGKLPFAERAGRVEFTLPRLVGHQMVALRLA